MTSMSEISDQFAHIHDGLTRKERVVLHCLNILQNELGQRNVPTAMLYGRVVEHVDMSVSELQFLLQKLSGKLSNNHRIE